MPDPELPDENPMEPDEPPGATPADPGEGEDQEGFPIGAAGDAEEGGEPIDADGDDRGAAPIGEPEFRRAGPIDPLGGPGSGGAFISVPGVPPAPSAPLAPPEIFAEGNPIGGPASIFNIGGAPIAILGGVFRGGLPLGGPVSRIFRGVGPQPNTLFIATISPAGPIGDFFIGTGGGPIGVEIFGGGGLPIGAPQEVELLEERIQPRTALVTTPAIAFGGGMAEVPVPGIVGEPEIRL